MQNEEFKNKAFRLVYVDIDYYTSKQLKMSYLDQNYFISNPYSLPNGMSLEDACKVVSFISETTEREEILPDGMASSARSSAFDATLEPSAKTFFATSGFFLMPSLIKSFW